MSLLSFCFFKLYFFITLLLSLSVNAYLFTEQEYKELCFRDIFIRVSKSKLY